jgi:hypothetical protein
VLGIGRAGRKPTAPPRCIVRLRHDFAPSALDRGSRSYRASGAPTPGVLSFAGRRGRGVRAARRGSRSAAGRGRGRARRARWRRRTAAMRGGRNGAEPCKVGGSGPWIAQGAAARHGRLLLRCYENELHFREARRTAPIVRGAQTRRNPALGAGPAVKGEGVRKRRLVPR